MLLRAVRAERTMLFMIETYLFVKKVPFVFLFNHLFSSFIIFFHSKSFGSQHEPYEYSALDSSRVWFWFHCFAIKK